MSGISIPDDMNNAELAKSTGAEAVVSIRDFMVLLCASDQVLSDYDERKEILEREPWRQDGQWFEVVGELNGMKCGFTRGEIDWSGTRFENMPDNISD